MVFVGKRSYSLYLNHWPAAILGTLIFGARSAAIIFTVVLLLVVTEASYRLVELPFIRLGKSLAAAMDSRTRAESPSLTAERPLI